MYKKFDYNLFMNGTESNTLYKSIVFKVKRGLLYVEKKIIG